MLPARRVFALVSMAMLCGCGYPTNPDGSEATICVPIEGLRLESVTSRGEHEPLAVGQTRVFSAKVGPAKLPCSIGNFTWLEWYADMGDANPNVRVRLLECEACTLLYEDHPGHFGVLGAATVERGEQRVTFEVTGLRPGFGSMAVFACIDKDCVQAASDRVFFDVTSR